MMRSKCSMAFSVAELLFVDADDLSALARDGLSMAEAVRCALSPSSHDDVVTFMAASFSAERSLTRWLPQTAAMPRDDEQDCRVHLNFSLSMPMSSPTGFTIA